MAKSKTSDVPTLMPQYSCLVLSPANFWHQDVNEFSQDSTILTTIFNQHVRSLMLKDLSGFICTFFRDTIKVKFLWQKFYLAFL